jgi:hypothetical protein
MQARLALLPRPLCAHTAAQQPRCAASRRTPALPNRRGVLIWLTRFARLNIPEHDRSDVLPCFLSWASASSIAASHAISSLPNPQLDKYRTVVGELIPDGFVGLPIGDLAERGAIDPGHHPTLDNNMIDEFHERIVPATDGHLLRQRGEIGVGPLAAASIQPSRTGTCASNVSQAELVEAFSKHPLLRCTDIS